MPEETTPRGATPTETTQTDDGQAAFEEFYLNTGSSLLRQLHALTGDRSEAQDCVQEAFARAWERWPKVRRYDQPAAWVRTVAVRLAISRIRRTRNRVLAHLRAGPAPDSAGPEPDMVYAVRLLRDLPHAQREALVLYHLLDLPVSEIAALTGSAEGTVRTRLVRARAAVAAASPGTTPTDLYRPRGDDYV